MSFSNNCATEQSQCLSPYTTEEIAQLAEFARQTGFKIFPATITEGRKKPCCKRWLDAATSEPAELFKRYIGQADHFGLPCKSNGFVVIDCDVKHAETFGNGIEQYHAYCKKHDTPLSPVWQSTPSGGRQYFYKVDFPEVIRGRVNITLDGNLTNIDIRSPGGPDGDGTYIVSDLPGRSGYEWHGDWSQIPPLPRHLVEELKEKPYQAATEKWDGIIGGEVPERILRIVEKRLAEIAEKPEGDRNDTLFKLSCNICRWLLPFPGEWEKWESRILDAAVKSGLSFNEAKATVESAKEGGEADGPYAPERYQTKEQKVNGFVELPKEAFSEKLWHFLKALADKCSTSIEIALANLLALVAQCLGFNRYI